MSQTAYKWVPVIDHDACTGCGLCVTACDRGCLKLVWDFATFQCAADCGSCGHCQDACQHDVLRMGWVKTSGSAAVGRWCDEPVSPADPVRRGHWLLNFLARTG